MIGLYYRQLQQAMAARKQIILKRYFSEKSDQVSNRKVEPIRLIDQEMVMEAFDVRLKRDQTL